jgi:quercetin dioxygenase-like cupin family protein
MMSCTRKEKTMKRLTLFVTLVALFHLAGYSSAQQSVERKGVASAVKLEGENLGFLSDLNGKYKLVATQLTFEPGGYVGEHNHAGPGIRYVVSGEFTLVEQGKATVYKAGDYFFETGAITNRASNKGSSPAVLIIFEILPADWKGGSTVPPKSK